MFDFRKEAFERKRLGQEVIRSRLKRLSIKSVVRGQMELACFIPLMLQQAQSEERLRLALKAQWRRGEWDPTP